jgi:hypothetical protein
VYSLTSELHGACAARSRTLVDEIGHTARCTNTVGNKVLGFCIPSADVARRFHTGQWTMTADLPNERTTSFCYFDPVYSELQQYGPVTVSGARAVIAVETQNDPTQNRQRALIKFLKV